MTADQFAHVRKMTAAAGDGPCLITAASGRETRKAGLGRAGDGERRALLRARLLARQSTADLKRKAQFASRRQRIWTQEEIDLARRRASENRGKIKWE